MTDQGQKNQAYLQWFFRMHEPQVNWAESEIRPHEILQGQMPHHHGEVERWLGELLGKPNHDAAKHRPGRAVNPWAIHGLAAARSSMAQ